MLTLDRSALEGKGRAVAVAAGGAAAGGEVGGAAGGVVVAVGCGKPGDGSGVTLAIVKHAAVGEGGYTAVGSGDGDAGDVADGSGSGAGGAVGVPLPEDRVGEVREY